ncbi:hypothetical protein D3C87_1725050 [compost metagenome]
MQRGQHHGADNAESTGFRRSCKTEEKRAEHEEDQHDRRHHAPEDTHDEGCIQLAARLRWQRRDILRADDRQDEDEAEEDQDLEDRGPDRAEIHVADRTAELVCKHDENERRRDDLGNRA